MDEFNLVQEQIAYQICTAPTAHDAFKIWNANRLYLRGCKFIYSNDHWIPMGFVMHRDFRKDFLGPGFLRSIYSGHRLLFIDEETMSTMNQYGGVNVPVDYSIMFDTNSAIYLRSLSQGKTSEAVRFFAEIFGELVRMDLNFDYAFYLIENRNKLGNKLNVDSVYNELLFLERLRFLDRRHFVQTGEMRPEIPMEELIKNATEKMSLMIYRKDEVDQGYDCMYILLLEIVLIHFRNKYRPISEKIEALCDFMHSEFSTVFLRILAVGAAFFERGPNLRFFRKIHRGNPHLLEALKNMAWDLRAICMMDQLSTYQEGGGRYFLPLLLTFDQGLVEMLELYPIQACALMDQGRRSICFPKENVFSKFESYLSNSELFREKYFSIEARLYRLYSRERKKRNLTTWIESLEKEITKLNESI